MTPENGWAQMKPILEKEMPVASQSRRFLLFWWAAAAIFTSSIIAAFSLIQSPEILSSSPAITEARNNQQDPNWNQTSITEQSTTGQQTENGELTDVSSPASTTRNSTTEKNTIEKIAATELNAYVSEDSYYNIDLSVIATLKNQNTKAEVLDLGTAMFGQPTVDHYKLNPDNVEKTPAVASNDSRVNVSILPKIDYLDASELETQTLAIGTVHPGKSSKFKRANNLLTPHLTVGAMKEFQVGLGAHGGAGLDINVSPRLSLTADLGYSIHSPDAVLFGGKAAADKEQESFAILRNDLAYEGIGNYLPIEVVKTASGQVISQFVETVNQWQVSAGLKYDLSRRFFVQAGATYGFGTTSRSTYPIVSNDIDNVPTTGNAITVENSFDTYDVLKNTISVTAGIGYKISPKTEVYAQWSHGLNPYLEGNSEPPLDIEPHLESVSGDNYIRGIDFGLRHSL